MFFPGLSIGGSFNWLLHFFVALCGVFVRMYHALITWLSCTAHLADHAMITQLPCTGHMTDHALIT